MRYKELRGWLEEIFYKPGWEFDIIPDQYDRFRMRIKALVLDSTTYPIDRTKMVTVIQDGYVPEYVDSRSDFYRWLQYEILRLEKHESQEWLRSFEDGKPLDDPHKHDRRF